MFWKSGSFQEVVTYERRKPGRFDCDNIIFCASFYTHYCLLRYLFTFLVELVDTQININ